MSPSPQSTIRLATESDIPALLSLLLTSFRQFQLFSFLYSPLTANKEVAFDTLWSWRRRLLLDFLDPLVEIVVAEVDESVSASLTKGEEPSGDVMVDESWRMLEWVTTRGRLSQKSRVGKARMVVGFAIWRVRENVDKSEVSGVKKGWISALRTSVINAEIWFWNKVYTRKDQDLAAYAAYLEAEEELEEKYYADTCYYLDNVCVDFRYQRLGIGSELVEWGLANARSKGLPVQTEAGPMGLGMYLKLGFKRIGTWSVPTANGEEEFMEFPVLKLEFPAEERPEIR